MPRSSSPLHPALQLNGSSIGTFVSTNTTSGRTLVGRSSCCIWDAVVAAFNAQTGSTKCNSIWTVANRSTLPMRRPSMVRKACLFQPAVVDCSSDHFQSNVFAAGSQVAL